MQKILRQALHVSGEVLMDYFGHLNEYTEKQNQSNIVTQADVDSEKKIVEIIKKAFPEHSIIAEESGFIDNHSNYLWIIDPLDGTSNYAAGIPWFGSMIAVLENAEPILAGINLPYYQELYFAEKGKGATKNGRNIRVVEETKMRNALISYSLDFSEDVGKIERETAPIVSVVRYARNIRSTNSVMDACYVADGRFGGCVYRTAKIWDVAAQGLVIIEAGGLATDAHGQRLNYTVNQSNYLRNFSFVGANETFHPEIIEFIKCSKNTF